MESELEEALAALVTREQLRGLAERYARGVDQRDLELFLSVFTTDGSIEVRLPGARDDEIFVQRGHEGIRPIIDFIKTYPKTLHMLGQSTYEIDDDRATGEIYCLAHHLDPAYNGPSNYVMYIRYEDRYRRLDGKWLIENRRVNTEWTDRRIASD